jgi:D-glycero-D-manno-heptose 1,7-bisphosphate phosphatase
MNFSETFDASWTLFLDRDGIINVYLPDDYVKHPREFAFNDGACDAIRDLSKIFNRVVVVTNQRGVARGLMTLDDLQRVHEYMLGEIRAAGGRIDGIYFCPHDRDDNCACRKPKTGLALQAKEMYPDIDFKKSIIVGDSVSDMKFGENCGMRLAYVAGHDGEAYGDTPVFSSLADFRDSVIGKERT